MSYRSPSSWTVVFGFQVLAATLSCRAEAQNIGASSASSGTPANDRAGTLQPATTLAALLDRAQIEDMLVEYYGDLGDGHGHRAFGSFYTEDGILDVNGIKSRGRKAIDDLYAKLEHSSSVPRGPIHTLLTNPKIVVNGGSATADTVWTEIISDAVKAPPRLVAQGRERDEFIKRNGHWYFKHRWISSDAGLEPMFEKTYERR